LWQEAKQSDWQPTWTRDYAGRCRAITSAIGSVRLVDLDPFRVDAWVAEMRKAGVGEGAIRSRVSALRSALSWGISRRWLYEVFMRAAKRAGIPAGRDKGIVLHDLRHWAASTALRDGHDPVTVAARLGHSPETLLRVYAQEIEHGQADVAASLAARLDG
jgi:integrase